MAILLAVRLLIVNTTEFQNQKLLALNRHMIRYTWSPRTDQGTRTRQLARQVQPLRNKYVNKISHCAFKNEAWFERADIEGSKSNFAMNAWLPQVSYSCWTTTERRFFVVLPYPRNLHQFPWNFLCAKKSAWDHFFYSTKHVRTPRYLIFHIVAGGADSPMYPFQLPLIAKYEHAHLHNTQGSIQKFGSFY